MSFAMGGDVNRDVTITFIGRDQASTAMRNISGTASKTTRTAQLLSKSLRAVGIAAATALAAGAAIAAKVMWDATKAAYADKVAMEKLAFIQKKAQDATDAQVESTADLIDKLELATGIADDEMRPALAALAGTGMSVKKSQDLLALAMDVSVARGKSLQTVSEALSKAYNGQLTGLTRLGIKVTDANGDALEFSQVLKQLQDRFGGAARAAGKTDPLKRLQAAWNQTQEALGEGLLPVLRQFTRWMINTGVPWVKEHLVPAIKSFGQWIKRNQDNITGWWNALKGAWNVLQMVWHALTNVTRWITNAYFALKKFLGMDTSFLTDVKLGLIVLQHPLEMIKGYFADLWSQIVGVASAVRDLVNAIASLPTAIPGWLHDHLPGIETGGWIQGRAQGGWTMVGERGPELINKRGFVRPHSASMGAGGGGGPTIIIQGAIDPVSTARQVERILAKGGRVTGRGALAVG